MQSLQNKKTIITGGGKGVGKATALALAKEGVQVGLIGRTEATLQAIADEINSEGSKCFYAVADVTDADAAAKAIEHLQSQLEGIDILINNAAIAMFGSTVDMMTSDWERIFRVNVFGTYYITKAALPYLIKQNSGDIVTISSSAGLRANAAAGAYSASKFAVIGFMESLMNEVRKYNIRVSTLMPSTMATDMAESLGIVQNKDSLMQPEDLAQFIVHQLKLDNRVFVKSASLWGTNP